MMQCGASMIFGPGPLPVISVKMSNGRILRTFLIPNAHTRGFRAGVDVAVDPGLSTDLRVFLRSGAKALTETWTFPWRV